MCSRSDLGSLDIFVKVLIRYGKFSNATLLLDFGFTLPYNIHDQVSLGFNLSCQIRSFAWCNDLSYLSSCFIADTC